MSRRVDTVRIVTLVCTALLLASCALAAATALAHLWSASLGRDGSSFALRSHLWIHEGLLPYRDLWDHKPPGIYAFNALGELATGKPVSGARAAESVILILTIGLAFRLGRRSVHWWVWGVALAFWYLVTTTNPAVVQWGDFTELALPPIVFALALELSRRGVVRWSLAGLLVSIAVLFRPTAVGLLAGLLAVLMLRESSWGRRMKVTLLILAGAAVPGLILLAWAVLHRLLRDMWDQVVTYNRLYAREAGASAISNLARGWRLEVWKIPGGIPLLVLLVCLGILVLWKRRAPTSSSQNSRTAEILALFAGPSLVVIWSLESLSGRFWPHQLMTAAPLLVVLLAAVAAPAERTTLHTAIWATTVVSAFAVISYIGWWASGNTLFRPDASRIAAVKFLQAASSPNDRLQVWGSEDLLYLQTGLLPASRYTYYYPLLTPGYATPKKTREFFSELERNRPRWVVTYGRDTTLSPSRARAPVLAAFSSWLEDRARPVRRFRNLIIWEISDRSRGPSPG